MASRAVRFQGRSRSESPFLARDAGKAKELFFLGVLKAELVSLGCTVAVPEPDVGDDLWVHTPGGFGVVRSQLKTAWNWQGKAHKSYVFNINEKNVTDAGLAHRFVYFLGMKHPEGPVFGFHVACLPGGFLDKYLKKKGKLRRIRPGSGNKPPSTNRVRFNILEVQPQGRQRKVRWFLEPSKGIREDITDYVGTYSALFGGDMSNTIMDYVSS